MSFFKWKRTCEEEGFSLKYPSSMKSFSFDFTSITFIDPKLPEESLTLSRILIDPEEPPTTQQIIDGEKERLKSEGLTYEPVSYKTTKGIYTSKKSVFSESEKEQLLKLDPAATESGSIIHRWFIGNEDICFIFSYGHPENPGLIKTFPNRRKVLETIFNSIKTKKLHKKRKESQEAATQLYNSFSSFMYGSGKEEEE